MEVVGLNTTAEVSGQVNGVGITTGVCQEAGTIVVGTIPRFVVTPASDTPPLVRASKGTDHNPLTQNQFSNLRLFEGKERMLQEDAVDAVVGSEAHDKDIELDGGFGIQHSPPCMDDECSAQDKGIAVDA